MTYTTEKAPFRALFLSAVSIYNENHSAYFCPEDHFQNLTEIVAAI